MKTVSLTNFNNYYGNELVDRCMRQGIGIDAIICIGEHVKFKDRRIFWEYTNFAEGLHLVDLEKYGIPIYIFKDINSKFALKKLNELQPDLLLQAGAGILKKEVIGLPKIGIINSHPGILPKYRGSMAVEWSIFNDDPVGATCHFVDEGIDTGPIICSQRMRITRGMDYHDVRFKAFSHQMDVMIEGIRKIQNGLRHKDAQPQTDGHCRKPMDAETLDKVKEMLNLQRYGHYADAAIVSLKKCVPSPLRGGLGRNPCI